MSEPASPIAIPRADRSAFGGGAHQGSRGAWLARLALIAMYVLVNGIVLYNARHHDPRAGYDAAGHYTYAIALAEGRLPTAKDSHEFFSPTLPYLPVSLSLAAGVPVERAFKVGQYANFVYSLALTFFLLKLCRYVSDDLRLRCCVLGCLGMVPAYYKTMAMFRGEPLLATLAVIAAYLAVRTFVLDRRSVLAAAALGLTLGLAIVSRQWGFFLIPPVFGLALWRMYFDRPVAKSVLRAAVIALIVLTISGGWFYAHLYKNYGTIRAFNRPPVAISSRPLSFYFGVPLPAMIEKPTRFDSRPRQLLPILYNDTWGDYWFYFLIAGRNRGGEYIMGSSLTQITGTRRTRPGGPRESNVAVMEQYLSRVMIVSALPTLVLLSGVFVGLAAAGRIVRTRHPPGQADATLALAAGIVFVTVAGFLWFVLNYTDETGDTIKASYVLQAFPFAALLAGTLVFRIWLRWKWAGILLAVLLSAAWAHNASAMITQYDTFRQGPLPEIHPQGPRRPRRPGAPIITGPATSQLSPTTATTSPAP